MSDENLDKLLYRAPNRRTAAFLGHRLTQAGIRFVEVGSEASIGLGDLPTDALEVEVFVSADDATRAVEILAEFEREHRDGLDLTNAWTCSGCGEHNDSTFEVCWQCQKPRG